MMWILFDKESLFTEINDFTHMFVILHLSIKVYSCPFTERSQVALIYGTLSTNQLTL